MKKIIFTFFAACLAMVMFATDVNYTVDNTTIFPNPERGFITMFEGHLSNSEHYAVKGRESSITKHANTDKGSLILVLYYLDEFKATATLPSWVLSSFDEDMAVLREKGMKCILRFAYTNSDADDTGHDAPLSIIEQHIAQYKSHWAANTDVIFCFQAGFIGSWGEWYYSDNFGNHGSEMNSSRKAFLDTLLNATPQNRYVQIRTPLFKTGYMDSIYGSHAALTSAEAYTGTAKARLGHHNDAFLYHYDNMGTYSDTATQKPYIAQETLYVPIGGESDITDTEQAATEATYAITTAEMSRLHWTFIQSGFSKVVTDMWRDNGTFDTLNVHMGYRYQLLNGSYGDAVTVGNQLSVNMTIKNVGYAPLYNERHAYIVLKNENATYALQLLSVDPRTWLPNGATATINENVMIPDTVYNGTYDLYLWLPDAYESIKNDARYAVRFANTGVWDDETGLNDLGAKVTVSGGSDAPDTSIPLPATLDKSNVESYSSDMTWYGASNEYFDFGPTSGYNLDRWAEWKLRLLYPGKYIISEVCASGHDKEDHVLGHSWKLLLSDTDSVSGYTTEAKWKEGEITYSTKWDLTSVPAGVYKLRVMNVTKWGQPKLKSLTLSYDGDIPSGMEEAAEIETDGQMYDILGRPVDESYRGVIIMRGKKILR